MRFDFNDNKLTNIMCEIHDTVQTGSVLYFSSLLDQSTNFRSFEVHWKGAWSGDSSHEDESIGLLINEFLI